MNFMIIIPSLSGGGAERVAITLAGELNKHHKVHLVTYVKSEDNYDFDRSLNIICLDRALANSSFKKVFNTICRIISLKRVKKKLGIDCSISLLPTPNFENVLSKNKEKVIISVRTKCSVNTHGVYKWMNSFSGNHADKVVTLSKNVMYDEEEYFGISRERLQTIYNPCDIERIQAHRADSMDDELFEEIRKSSDFLAVTAGRTIEAKGQWHLIRAFSKVVENHPNARLVIFGQGALENYQKELIHELGLQDKIYMLGFHPNIYAYLLQCDVFCFSSLYEGFGNILLEAMACGLPIVTTDCDAGPRELLAPDTDSRQHTQTIEYAEYGILTPQHDWEKYTAAEPLTESESIQADALIRIMRDEELRAHYRRQSAKRVQDFKTDVIMSQWLNLIENKDAVD